MPRLEKNLLFVWVFQNIWCCDRWITPWLKWSLLCIVECGWSILSQGSYMSMHLLIRSILITSSKSVKVFWCSPDYSILDRIIRLPVLDGSGTRRMIRPYTGSSGPGHPPIYRPAPAPAPLSHFFHSSTAAASCFFHSTHGDLAIWPWVFATGGLFGFPSLRRLCSPPSLLRNFLICVGNSKVTHSKLSSPDLLV